MTRNIQKIFAALCTCCLLLTVSAAQAENDCCCNSCECAPECFCNFPNYNPCCTGVGDGFQLTLEFLWWKPCFSDLDYGMKFDTATVGNNRTCGNYLYPGHQFSPGLRVGLDLDNVWCGWDLMFHYEWVQEKARREDNNNTGLLVSTLFHGGFNDDVTAQTLNTSHKFQYQTFDILLGQDFCVSPCHYFVPFFGFQGVKLDQTWKSLATEVSGELTETADLRWDSTYEGLGLAVGVGYHYRLSCIEFFTDAKLMAVRGCNVSRYQLNESYGATPTVKHHVFKTDDTACSPGLHLQAGINYVYEYCGTELVFTLGYEFVNWFNMPQVRRFTDSGTDIGISSSPNSSGIGFHGLNVGLGFSM